MGFLSEVKRRNVHRMAALYAVVAWLIMQVTDVVIGLAGLPDGAGRVVLTLLAIGFPIALTFSWFYALTPEGLSLEKDVEPRGSITHATGRRMDFMVIGLLSAALIVLAYDKWWATDRPISSLAVLPIKAISADPEIGYLAEGMTFLLPGELGRIDSLSVTSATSTQHYRAADKSLPEIASELNVDALLEGSIQQFEGRLRIGMQLVDGRTDRQLWSGVFDRGREDLMTLQGEIAATIAKTINISLTPEVEAQFARDRTVNPNALRYWAIALHHLNELDPGSFEKALQALQAALRYDPEFAEAHAGIALVRCNQASWFGTEKRETALPLARAAVDRALELNPDLADAHFALGAIHRLDWEWQAAERALRTGLQLSRNVSGFPAGALGQVEFANLLLSLGRTKEAIELAQEAVEIDPLTTMPHVELGWAYFLDGQPEAALVSYRRALALEPDDVQTNLILVDAYLSMGQIDEAMPYLERWKASKKTQSPTIQALLGLYYGLAGRPEETREIFSDLQTRATTEFVPAIAFAYLNLALKRHDEVIRWLEAAYEERDMSLVWLNVLWVYDVLRGDPRFQDLVGRMGLAG